MRHRKNARIQTYTLAITLPPFSLADSFLISLGHHLDALVIIWAPLIATHSHTYTYTHTDTERKRQTQKSAIHGREYKLELKLTLLTIDTRSSFHRTNIRTSTIASTAIPGRCSNSGSSSRRIRSRRSNSFSSNQCIKKASIDILHNLP